ncbi:MAG: lysylphosphatidylglycerol synthase transmembrane domain-containing protein, partial [Desulfovibrionales bacterium]
MPKILRFVAFLAIGLVLLFFAFRGVDFSEMANHLKDAKYSWIGLSLFIAILSHISRARRWILLIEPINDHKPSLWNTVNAVLFGYFANYALPRMGEITRCVSLGRKEKISVNSLIGTVIIERAIDLISMFLILLFLLIARFEKFGAFFNDYIFHPIGVKIDGAMNAGIYIFFILLLIFILTVLFIIFRRRLLNTKPLAADILEEVEPVGGHVHGRDQQVGVAVAVVVHRQGVGPQ